MISVNIEKIDDNGRIVAAVIATGNDLSEALANAMKMYCGESLTKIARCVAPVLCDLNVGQNEADYLNELPKLSGALRDWTGRNPLGKCLSISIDRAKLCEPIVWGK